MIPWPQVLWSLIAEAVIDWWKAAPCARRKIPKQCAGCLDRRPKDRIQWEFWEARHAKCEPVGQEVPW